MKHEIVVTLRVEGLQEIAGEVLQRKDQDLALKSHDSECWHAMQMGALQMFKAFLENALHGECRSRAEDDAPPFASTDPGPDA